MCGNRHYGPHPGRHPQNVQVSPSVSAHHSEIWAISPHVPERMTYAVQTWTSCHPQFVKRRGKIWDAQNNPFRSKKTLPKAIPKATSTAGFWHLGHKKRVTSRHCHSSEAQRPACIAQSQWTRRGSRHCCWWAQGPVMVPQLAALALVKHVRKNWWKDPPCYKKRKSTN